MKRIYRTVFLCLGLMLCSGILSAQQIGSDAERLPEKARKFLDVYYARTGISSVSAEVKSFFKDVAYYVRLRDGKQIAFDNHGNWQELDGCREPLPSVLVPHSVRMYLARSFPRNDVVKMQRDDRRYVVAISNGLKLEFNNKGEFIKINQQ